jgi:ankyrin repeat protein
MVLNSPDLRATNSAGQTFLHVLNIEWFSDLTSLSAPLKQLLAYLRDTAPDMVYLQDVYGRTFFHRVHSLIRDSEILDGILSPFNPALSSRRDAFGFNPLANTNLGGEGPFIPPRRLGLLTPLPEERPGSSRGRSPQTSREEDAFVAYHARLLQIIQASYDNPRIEDEEGRNGLHCLAEGILNQQTMDEQRTAKSTGRALKRKYDRHTPEGGSEGPLASRLRHLQGLLRSRPPLDVNHYDKAGNTVLGAFIAHLPDDQEDKAKSLSTVLETLIGAGARVEGRNRRGETPLLVAARLGRKIALTTLLERGANVHVRDVDGRGVLQVIDATCRAARDDVALYARLEACRVLLTGRRDWGVVQCPTVLQEWRTMGCE